MAFGRGLSFLLPWFGDDVALSDATPDSEAVFGAAGGATKASRDDHIHPRLTSAHSAQVLDASGLCSVTFTRTFTTKPAIMITGVQSAGSVSPVMLEVQSYTMANGLYTGCVVRGYKGITLPGTLVLLSALISFNVFLGSANNIEFTLIALQTS